MVDVLTPEDCSEIIIPKPELESIQKEIGDSIIKAFKLRAEASKIELETINYLEEVIYQYPIF